MENATKALLIAGGVLIAIIILSIGVTLYTLFSRQAKEYNQMVSTTEIQKFNSKFDVYVGRENITAQEIASVVNLAKEYDGIIEIWLGTTKIQTRKTSDEFMTDNKNTFKTSEEFIAAKKNTIFSCKYGTSSKTNPVYNQESGLITKITFTENT